MTFILAIKTHEGMVLATESGATNERKNSTGASYYELTDNHRKLFEVKTLPNVGILLMGQLTFAPGRTELVADAINRFALSETDTQASDLISISTRFSKFFFDECWKHDGQITNSIFHIGGFDESSSSMQVLEVDYSNSDNLHSLQTAVQPTLVEMHPKYDLQFRYTSAKLVNSILYEDGTSFFQQLPTSSSPTLTEIKSLLAAFNGKFATGRRLHMDEAIEFATTLIAIQVLSEDLREPNSKRATSARHAGGKVQIAQIDMSRGIRQISGSELGNSLGKYIW